MSEPVAKQAKKIAKAKVGRQVRLWVRAKFLSFRRYYSLDSGPKLPKTPTKPSSDSKVSMTVQLPSTTSERESLTSTKSTLERPRTDIE